MRSYRVYHVGRRGTVTPAGAFDCDTDEAALEKLSSFAKADIATELWQGDRYVGKVAQRVVEERR